jgi:membrane fusion protein (multidrug efflux system)
LNTHQARTALATISTTLLLLACAPQDPQGANARVPEVGFVVMAPQRLTLGTQLPGRTVAFRIAQVRPQVSGIIKQRLYTEGANVAAGQALYALDAAPFKAAYDSAQAAVAKADANELTVRLRFERYQKLAASGDVSQQDRDDVTANLSQAQADQAIARAALETARINLGYTRIVAPIAGRTGTSAFTEGALVTANQDSPLTTVQQYDPMYVDLSQSVTDLLKVRAEFAAGRLRRADDHSAAVRLQLDDGSEYAHDGRLEFTGVSVSESTGAVTLRAIFPNPEGRLLPGMYVRAQVSQGVDDTALVVPQQAVARDARGEATALVVGADDKVELRTLRVSEAGNNQWRVDAGLENGDRVIVQGLLNLRPGTKVKASPLRAPAQAP